MNAVQGFAVTSAGRNLFAKLTATARPLNFSRVVFGTGKLPEGSVETDLLTMTALVEPLAEGTYTTPIYKNDTVSMVLEFRSDLNGGLTKTVWLNEFGLFAADPDGEEVLVCYGNLGDCPDSVLAFRDGANTVRDYPVTLIIGAVPDVQLSAPAGAFLTSEDASSLIEDCLSRAVGMKVVQFVIPTNSWEHDPDGFYADVDNNSIKATHFPFATLAYESMSVAAACGFRPVVNALDGKLRFYSQLKPDSEISGTCCLFSEGAGGGTSGSSPMAIATATTLGGVKVGNGISVTSDGTISVNPEKVMTDEDLVDENEVAQSVANILNGDEA